MKKRILFIFVVATIVCSTTIAYFTSNYILKNRSIITKTVNEQSDVDTHFVYNQSKQTSQQDGCPNLVNAAESTVKGVVNIVKTEVVESKNRYYGSKQLDPFLELFGIPQEQLRQRQQQQPQSQERVSGGSGVIISSDGYIVSNNHVVENASSLKVTLNDGKSYDAEIVGTDPTTDIALLKIDAENLSTVPFGDSDLLRLGEWVLAVGSPYGLNSTVTAGIVSAKGRNLDIIPSEFRLESFIQTDAAVNPGNSGGALVNIDGELIGINTVIKSPTGSYTGYSFAVPSSIVRKVISDLKEYGIVQRAMLGIGYSPITDEFIERNNEGITEKDGLYIVTVDPNGAAGEAGVEIGDVLIEFDGVKTNSSSALQEAIAKYRPSDRVELKIKRDGEIISYDVLLRNRSGEAKLLDGNSVDMDNVLGAKFKNISQEVKDKLDIDSGIQVVALGSGLLQKSGIKVGYIITQINGMAINDIRDISKITNEPEIIDGVYPNGKYISYYIVNK